MLSAVITAERSYPALPLAGQLVHWRFVRPGPFVLGTAPLKSPAPTVDRDRTVSRRSKPSSRTALTGEQPDPWDPLQPQDAMSRHRFSKKFFIADYFPLFKFNNPVNSRNILLFMRNNQACFILEITFY